MDQSLISLNIPLLQILEKPPPLPDKLEETKAGVVILNMDLEVLGEVFDPLTQQGNLHLRRSGIGVMESKLLNNSLFLLLNNPHVNPVCFAPLPLSTIASSILLHPCKAE